MTDEALDLFAKQVILDALRFERENTGETKTGFSPSKKYQHQMREMVADPQGWCQRKMRPAWKKALRRVAAVFLAATVGVSAWLAVDTNARAAFVGWVRELYEHSIVYRVAPVRTATTLPHHELIYLPDGFGGPDIYESKTTYNALYEKPDTEDVLIVDYRLLDDEVQTEFLTTRQPEKVTVNGVPADFFAADDDSDFNNLLWIDEDVGVLCSIDGTLPKEEILRIAEGMKFYTGNVPAKAGVLQDYRPTWLPDGWFEAWAKKTDTIHTVTYASGNEQFDLVYQTTEHGIASEVFLADGGYTCEIVDINGITGDFYLAESEADTNELVWLDEDANIAFYLSAPLPKSDMVQIAKSIKCCS